ncbi:MAG TPA: hypothetical protein VKT72_15735 [Candidatus Baltobacteraceae bacterium]|nr:hypothetical protein [Candidatus Baltobacteraceae bacterium]
MSASRLSTVVAFPFTKSWFAAAVTRRRLTIAVLALAIGAVIAHPLYASGIIGYVDDWNIPSTPHGLWLWGLSDLSAWRPIEYGMPAVYPTDFYLKLGLGLFGLLQIPTHLVTALFLTLCVGAAFAGMSLLADELWSANVAAQIAAGLLYVGSPILFDSLVPGYVTFVLSYAALPWMVLSLVRALRGAKGAWFAYGFFLALSLAQIQFVIFDALIVLAVLIALRADSRQWPITAAFSLIGGVLTYAFLFANLLGLHSLIGTATQWSEHSWTSLSAPGLPKALQLTPSAYTYFDQSLGTDAQLWHRLAIAAVVFALLAGVLSRHRLARGFAILLAVSLIFLHGANPPITAPMTWFMSLAPLAILRNVNYVFAVVAFCVSLLPCMPKPPGRFGTVFSIAAACFALAFAVPFLQSRYTAFLSVIPGPNTTESINGNAERVLVLPHLQVIDRRHPTIGGVNPNSVETITPIFVRNTPTGVLEASILDRLTDWTPSADSFAGALRAARVNTVALQTALGSTFPKFVYADHDEWLNPAYRTPNIKKRLDAISLLHRAEEGTTAFYSPADQLTGVQTASAVTAVSGSVESEITLRAAGMNGLFVSAEQLPDALHVQGLVQNAGAPPFVAAPADETSGAYVSAGAFANPRITDFHVDWFDPMAASDWWIDSRLLIEPHAALTDKPGASISVPVPRGRLHIWLEYYASALGGSVRISGPISAKVVSTLAPSYGEWRWIDLGRVRSQSGALIITSLHAFNAIGRIAMLTDAQERVDRLRFARFTGMGAVQILPNATMAGEIPLRVEGDAWKPSIVLANLSRGFQYELEAKLERENGRCAVYVGRARLQNVKLELDGVPLQSGDGAFFRIFSAPCANDAPVLLDGRTLSGAARLVGGSPSRLQLAVGGVRQTIPVRLLPLAFPALRPGRHLLRISSPPLYSDRSSAWTDPTRVAPIGNGAVRISLSTSGPPVDTGVRLRAPIPGEHLILTGTYTVSPGALARVMFYNGNPVGMYDMPGDGQPREFHWDLASVPRTHGDSLYVGLVKGARDAHVTMTLNQPLPDLSADLLLMEPRFTVVPEQQRLPKAQGFLRYGIDRADGVVQYDQTYAPGWSVSSASEHLESVAGFNLWTFDRQADHAVIEYHTGVIYVVAAAFSLAVFTLLGILAALGVMRRGPARSE